VRITKRDKVHVPWLELGRNPAEYLDVDTIPKGFEVLDPSKMTKSMIFQLWSHWSMRTKAKLPILIFLKALNQDLGLSIRENMKKAWLKRKRMAYAAIGSDDQASDEELDSYSRKGEDRADKGEGVSGPSIRPPLSKRPRLSGQPTVPREQSPAAHNSDRLKFLRSLSADASYKTLLDGMLALPVSVSSCFLFIHIKLI
jgi:hypothetical protein